MLNIITSNNAVYNRRTLSSLGKRSNLLVHENWPNYTALDLVDPEADQEMNWIISLIENIRSARQQMHVPAGLKFL